MIKNKTRVAFFADILAEDFDGAVRTMYQLINRVDKRRFEFFFVYGCGPAEIPGFRSFKVPAVTLPININYKIALPQVVQTHLQAVLQAFDADVIHIATPSWLGIFGLNFAAQAGLPVISIYHTHFVSYVDYYLKLAPFLIKPVQSFIAGKSRHFYNKCDVVYMPSQSIMKELTALGIAPSRMKIWKRGIDTVLFNPSHRNKSLIRNLTANNNPVILFASRLVWEKNLETLFRVYDQMQAGIIPVNFVIAGDGNAMHACRQRMPTAIFTGRVSHKQLSVLYASADVFIFPSVSEAYGNVVAEAMASGLPCIVADGGGSKDFIQHGINGYLCSPHDATDYCDKIVRLLASQTLRESFITTALLHSKEQCWDTLAEIYFEDLERLAQQPTPLVVLKSHRQINLGGFHHKRAQ